jgi:hypothetical protein
MKRRSMRSTIGVCVAGVLAIGGLTAASASAALPEFTGPFPKKFTSTSGVTIFETAISHLKVTCKTDKDSGEVTGPKTNLEQIHYEGCEANAVPCTTSGQAAGVIVTAVLNSTLGYLNAVKKTVGIDLEAPAGAPFTEFECGGVKVVMKGSLIGKVGPINKEVKTVKLNFKETEGKQKFTHFDGGPKDSPEFQVGEGPFEAGGVTSVEALRFEAATTIKG